MLCFKDCWYWLFFFSESVGLGLVVLWEWYCLQVCVFLVFIFGLIFWGDQL